MKGNTLYNVSDPVNPQDVATKEYADNVRGGGWVRKKQDGTYAIKRDLDMGFKKLLNLSVPSEPFEATKKDYVNKRPHIIAVHTHYSGNLRKGKYQFTFGEKTRASD